MATEELSSEDWSESQSTISIGTVRETEDLVFEYEEDDNSSVSTMCDPIQGIPRPKTGWNTSSFPSFGSLVAAANNTKIFPQAPKTARMYWNVATGGQFGHNAGVNDDVYLDRIEHVMRPRILSRQTPQSVRDALSKIPEKMPRDSNWNHITVEAWQKKFPDSSIFPDTVFQKTRDPKMNPNLPYDLFAPDDIEWLNQRPLSDTFQAQRKQQSVGVQGKRDK